MDGQAECLEDQILADVDVFGLESGVTTEGSFPCSLYDRVINITRNILVTPCMLLCSYWLSSFAVPEIFP